LSVRNNTSLFLLKAHCGQCNLIYDANNATELINVLVEIIQH
jgi:hypothetical protein